MRAGKVSFESFGMGSSSHIFGEMLKDLAGVDMAHVPYKGAAPAAQDLLAGHVTMGILDLAVTREHIRSGRLVVLALTGPQRWPLLPDLPTFAEQGYPLEMAGWNGILAPVGPVGVPRATVEPMSVEITRIIQTPERREQVLRLGNEGRRASSADLET